MSLAPLALRRPSLEQLMMDIAIGLPNWVPGIEGSVLVDWARRSEERGFSSLGTLGIIADTGQEELVALAAAAAVTERIGLATTVLVSPMRETALLAKQAATLDAISGGRFTLGLGAGWRSDDFAATGAEMGRRGRRLEEQIALMRRVWSGGAFSQEIERVTPIPARTGGPEILLGGTAPAALERAGRLADGFLAMPLPAPMIEGMYAAVTAAWQDAGREGRPRFVGGAYFALGDAVDEARGNIRGSYAALGGEIAERMAGAILTDADGIRSTVGALEAIGVDEVFMWSPAVSHDQIERLAEIVL